MSMHYLVFLLSTISAAASVIFRRDNDLMTCTDQCFCFEEQNRSCMIDVNNRAPLPDDGLIAVSVSRPVPEFSSVLCSKCYLGILLYMNIELAIDTHVRFASSNMPYFLHKSSSEGLQILGIVNGDEQYILVSNTKKDVTVHDKYLVQDPKSDKDPIPLNTFIKSITVKSPFLHKYIQLSGNVQLTKLVFRAAAMGSTKGDTTAFDYSKLATVLFVCAVVALVIGLGVVVSRRFK